MRFIIGVTSMPNVRRLIDTRVSDEPLLAAFADMSIGDSRQACDGFLTVVRVG